MKQTGRKKNKRAVSGGMLLFLLLLLIALSAVSLYFGQARPPRGGNETDFAIRPGSETGISFTSGESPQSGTGTVAETSTSAGEAASETPAAAATSVSSFADPDRFQSLGIVVLERGSGETIFSKNPDMRLEPASLTKIMTCLLAIEQMPAPDAVTNVDVDTYLQMVESNASMAGFNGNEAVTYEDLLYGTMLPSGGEAAGTLALRIGGTQEQFAAMMNEKAASLGLNNSHFANESGLSDPDTYSTAADMAALLDRALDKREFRTLFTAASYTSTVSLDHPEGVAMYSTVLSRIDPAATAAEGFRILGGKSGTELSGQNWATLGSKNGKEYIVVVMGAPLGDLNEPNNYQISDTMELYRQIP